MRVCFVIVAPACDRGLVGGVAYSRHIPAVPTHDVTTWISPLSSSAERGPGSSLLPVSSFSTQFFYKSNRQTYWWPVVASSAPVIFATVVK